MDPLTIKLLARLFSPEMLDYLLQQSPSRAEVSINYVEPCRCQVQLIFQFRPIFSFITYSKYIDSTELTGAGGKLQRQSRRSNDQELADMGLTGWLVGWKNNIKYSQPFCFIDISPHETQNNGELNLFLSVLSLPSSGCGWILKQY